MDNKKWYMITTISGKETKVIEALRNRAVSENMENSFGDMKVMIVPHVTPREMEKRNHGEDFKVRERNLFPGYIFIEMEMTNEAWFLVRNTQYVTGLVGSSGQRTKPTPVSNTEMRKMEQQVQKIRDDFAAGIVESPFTPGIVVEITDGPAKGQVGPVIESNDKRQVAIIELIMFERKTPTEIPHKFLKIVI